MEEASNAEYLLARKTAEEYRRKGYDVAIDVPLDFLPGFRADLLVRKPDEVKVIEVKSRSSLAADPGIRQLARVVDSRPGWSFELLLVAEPEKLDSPEGARSFDRGHVLQRIEEAEKALTSGLSEAALVLAWSGVRGSDAGAGHRSGRVKSGHQCPWILPRSGGFSRDNLQGGVSPPDQSKEVQKRNRSRVQS